MGEQLTVDRHAALFESCDIFIDTDSDGWVFILANPKARGVVNSLIGGRINWDFGTPVQQWWTAVPLDWRAVDLDFPKMAHDGWLSRLPEVDNIETAGVHPYSLRLGIAAQSAGLRVVMYDEKTGFRKINLQGVENVIDFASARETITRRRSKGHSHSPSNGSGRPFEPNPNGKSIGQNLILPGLPGGPPLVPVISFENSHLSGGRDVVDRVIRSGKPEPVVLQIDEPVATFPSHIHLFGLSPSICNSISDDDRELMLADLQTAGLLHLPFDQIAVRFYLPDLLPKSDRKVLVTFCVAGALSIHPRYANLVSVDKMFERLEVQTLNGKTDILSTDDLISTGKMALPLGKVELRTTCLDALTTLVLALATRNVVKQSTENKRINNKHKQSKLQFRGPQGAIYLSSTVVEAPAAAEMDGDPTALEGTAVRPHMRRGHLHTVLHGVGRRERRVQWFPSVFVNGDPTFTAVSRKYVVSRDSAV
jgi:hypothetical protein